MDKITDLKEIAERAFDHYAQYAWAKKHLAERDEIVAETVKYVTQLNREKGITTSIFGYCQQMMRT